MLVTAGGAFRVWRRASVALPAVQRADAGEAAVSPHQFR